MTAVPVKWRPPLWLVVTVVVGAVVALPTLGMAAVVAFSRSPEVLLQTLLDKAGRIIVAELVVLAAAFAVGYVFWRSLAGPIRHLVGATDRVAQGARDFEVTGPLGTQELAQLAESFAVLVERLQQRSRYLETFTAHLAHELKSPLAAIQGAAELLADESMDTTQRTRFVDNIRGDVDRLNRLVAELRELAHADIASETGETGLGQAIDTLATAFPQLRVNLEADPEHRLPLPPDGAAIVLHHLADNAVRHGASVLTVAVAGDGAILVGNDGNAIEPGNIGRLMTPFFTTRREDGGTGLGLAIVVAVLQGAGGSIRLASADPVGFALEFGSGSRAGSATDN